MKTQDPVCGMKIEVDESADKSEYNGKVFYFCAPGCKKLFDANPEKYVHNKDNAMIDVHVNKTNFFY